MFLTFFRVISDPGLLVIVPLFTLSCIQASVTNYKTTLQKYVQIVWNTENTHQFYVKL